MYTSDLAERLQARTLAVLAGTGRDRRRIRLALFRIMEELGAEAGREAWSGEYREFLLAEFRAALDGVLDESVAREEFEWAAAVFRLKSQIL